MTCPYVRSSGQGAGKVNWCTLANDSIDRYGAMRAVAWRYKHRWRPNLVLGHWVKGHGAEPITGPELTALHQLEAGGPSCES